MSKPVIILAALVLVLAAAAPARAETRTLTLGPFDRIAITSGIAAIVTVGGEQSVVAESDSTEILDRLRIDVRAGELRADIDSDWLDAILEGGLLSRIFGERQQILLRISVPALVAVESSAGASVEVDTLSGEELSLEATSGARLAISALDGGRVAAEATSGATLAVAAGTCERLDAESTSGATLDMAAVQCGEVIATATSGATATVFARDSIDAEATSGATVHVLGAPARSRVDSSSGGNVRID